MVEFIQRVLVGAIVSAVISAGLLYFAFDQSLRGVETAIETVSGSVQENGEWVRENRRAIDQSSDNISNQLQLLSNQIRESRSETQGVFTRIAISDAEWIGVVSNSITTTGDMINILKRVDGLSEVQGQEIERLLTRLEENRQQLEVISTSFSRE